MMKGLYTGLLFLSLSATAQDALQAETENGKPYLVHTVSSGETLSSIGRNFKLTVPELAAFNKINADKGLQKDQQLRIPLQTGNLTQTECSGCAKVYYKVQPREGLYRIGLNFGKVKAETLRELNNLPGESVDIGQNLLVGYLSAPAGKMSGAIARKATPSETAAPPKTDAGNTGRKTETRVPETVVQTEPPVADNKPKEQPKRTTPPETSRQQQTPVQQTPVQQTPVQQTPQPQTPTVEHTPGGKEEGVFAGEYQGKMNVSKTGTAAVFKSTSGWGDTKYYVLMNQADPGTIVRISHAATGKTIYAKVLAELPDIKQNENILVRISNAAAAALGGSEENMSISISY